MSFVRNHLFWYEWFAVLQGYWPPKKKFGSTCIIDESFEIRANFSSTFSRKLDFQFKFNGVSFGRVAYAIESLWYFKSCLHISLEGKFCHLQQSVNSNLEWLMIPKISGWYFEKSFQHPWKSNLKWSLLHKMSTNRTGQSVQVHDNDCRLLLVSCLDSLSPHSFRTRSVFHMTAKICHRLLL